MKSFQTYTPRVRRMPYDALIVDLGCQSITGTQYASAKPFERLCIFEHDAGSSTFTQSDLVAYAIGPFNTGNPPPWITPWAAWVASAGIRVGKLVSVTPPANNLGAPSSLFPTALTKKVALGFTSFAQMGIAIQLDESSIQIKWFESPAGDYSTKTFPGISPILFGNSFLVTSDDSDAADLVLYYIRPEVPRSLFARFERDDFDIERPVHSNLPVELGRLIGSKKVGDTQELYALDKLGRDLTFYSPIYAASLAGDQITLQPSINRGAYRQASVPVVVNTGNQATLSVAIDHGSYSDIIVSPAPLSGDKLTLSIAIESGIYE